MTDKATEGSNQAKELSNRDRALEVLRKLHLDGILRQADPLDTIEQALNDKDAFWQEEVQKAERRGAEKIREMAIKVSMWEKKSGSPTTDLLERGVAERIADAIRSLPLPPGDPKELPGGF